MKVIHSLILVSVYAVVLELFQSSYAFTQTIYPSSITRCAASSLEESEAPFSTPFNDKTKPIEQIPHEQRISNTRKARRLNHPFQHLFRHSDQSFKDDDWDDTISITDEVYDCYKSIFDIDDIDTSQEQLNSTFAQTPIDIQTSLLAIQYLNIHGGYSFREIQQMHARFPPLLEIDVVRHLRPKMRFLKDCLGGITSSDDGQILNSQLKYILPASFIGARLERTIAPRHAFLVHVGLPSGKALWDGTYQPSNSRKGGARSLLEQFLLDHRKPKQFAAMCNNLRSIYGSSSNLPITSEQIIAFDKLFQRGILSAARDDIQLGNNDKSPSLLQTANVTSAQLVNYLIEHGANPYETDVRGASLFHWCAGSGNLDGLKELVDGCDRLDLRIQARGGANDKTSPSNPGVHAALLWKASRDDATPFHWAAAGAGPKEFGIGGNIDVCNYLLELCKEYPIISQRKLIDNLTRDHNSILMWAAWSRSLDIVKLLVRNRADTKRANRNGCTVAHWACSGGDLSVCQYLHKMGNVDFTVENYQGNTPLSHSVAYARYDIAKWLKEDLKVEDDGDNAANLAGDFVTWAEEGLGLISEEEEIERRSVYSLFNSFND